MELEGIYPALSIANELKGHSNAEILCRYREGLEAKLVREGFEFKTIELREYQGKSIRIFCSYERIILGLMDSKRLLMNLNHSNWYWWLCMWTSSLQGS